MQLTNKEKMELLNLRKKVVAQRDEIKRLCAVIDELKKQHAEGEEE